MSTASFTEFKKINKQFTEISKHIENAEINIRTSYGPNYYTLMHLDVRQPSFKTFAKMHLFSKNAMIPLHGLRCNASNGRQEFWDNLLAQSSETGFTLASIHKDNTKGLKTLRLMPESIPESYRPWLIQTAPLEVTEGNHTYRFLSIGVAGNYNVSRAIQVICREDEPMYDYLDEGFYLMRVVEELKTGKTVLHDIVANAYDINTAHIFMMCQIQPDLIKLLKRECFINMHEAELLRLKLAKKLSVISKRKYNEVSGTIDNDYRKNTTLIVIGKLLNDSVASTEIQNITFTKSKATYEQVTVESEGLLNILHDQLNFNGEFDIYGICGILGQHIEKQLNGTTIPEGAAAESSTKYNQPEIKINGIPIVASVNAAGQRFVNGSRINKDEVSKVIHRASCYHNASDYKLFLKSISKMSMKFHDVVANGMQVKIHEMSVDEYKSHTPGLDAPSLKFFIDKEEGYKLEVSSNRSVRIHLGRAIRRLETVNKKTDNGWFYSSPTNGYRSGRRNSYWAVEQIVSTLVDCCTFEEENTLPDGSKRKESQCLITREDILNILSVVKDSKKEAIERSKIFMETAVKLTKAELVEFMGKRAYKVQGALRTYAVVIENAKVYDFETKQYRCIVNDHHYDGAGYDDVATRLLALKNDSVMQSSVSTLRGVAQPQYENAHAHNPEREAEFNVGNIVDAVLAKN
jgi:ribosomal protein L18E